MVCVDIVIFVYLQETHKHFKKCSQRECLKLNINHVESMLSPINTPLNNLSNSYTDIFKYILFFSKYYVQTIPVRVNSWE